MQHTFLSAYQLVKQMPKPATGVWLLHGDEDLLSQWFIEKLKPNWQAHQMTIARMQIDSSKSWQEILLQINSLSLFDDKKVIIAYGHHKPDKETLIEFGNFVKKNTENCLVIISQKYDKKSQKAPFFQLCQQHGQVVECHLYQENQREQLLKQQAQDFQLNLTDVAWQCLLNQTQHNLLSAYQALWRLSYLYVAESLEQMVLIDELKLQDGLVSQSHFTFFDLSDAMLKGDVQQVVNILQHLKHAQEPPSLVLWTIAKDMRAIQSLLAGVSYQELGIWQSKQSLYRQAMIRHQNSDVQAWTQLLYRCDQAIKGLIGQPAWEILYQLALALSDKPLFTIKK